MKGDVVGEAKVKDNFASLLKNVIGCQFIEVFKQRYPSSWMKFMTDFQERIKESKFTGQFFVLTLCKGDVQQK